MHPAEGVRKRHAEAEARGDYETAARMEVRYTGCRLGSQNLYRFDAATRERFRADESAARQRRGFRRDDWRPSVQYVDDGHGCVEGVGR